MSLVLASVSSGSGLEARVIRSLVNEILPLLVSWRVIVITSPGIALMIAPPSVILGLALKTANSEVLPVLFVRQRQLSWNKPGALRKVAICCQVQRCKNLLTALAIACRWIGVIQLDGAISDRAGRIAGATAIGKHAPGDDAALVLAHNQR